jgi:phosphatidate phosphatase APP1
MTPASPIPTAQVWHNVYLHWAPADRPDPAGETAPWLAAQVLTPPPGARFGVISDIDDTVLVSHAASPFRMALTALLNNARTRSPFPGVAAFYQSLQAGVRGDEHNPIFYVSSSPWNFYDLLVEFMQVNEIPAGPLLLRDYGRQNLRDIGHRDHKRQAIDALLAAYPALPFVLMGDSGQEDPEIYASVVQDFPDRILGIHIRDVTPGSARRRQEIAALAEGTAAAGAPLLFSAATADAVHFARRLDLIR